TPAGAHAAFLDERDRVLRAACRGPAAAQRGVLIGAFCQDFNERTRDVKPGVLLRVRLLVHATRQWGWCPWPSCTRWPWPSRGTPRCPWGGLRGSLGPGHEAVGVVSLAQLYEVALAKQRDPSVALRGTPLPALVGSLVGSARSLGLHVVPSLTPQAVAEFQRRRREELEAAAAAEGEDEGAKKK
ncbi:39S ribosomal protein L11, mitochondrial, partial [Myiozetetes cayanensis]|uniref:39S ribosomal protein L11, mitochondrial n=1 Tax=Myiozetetes cayanensis TaxID=478635 RepID=UPI00215F1D8F